MIKGVSLPERVMRWDLITALRFVTQEEERETAIVVVVMVWWWTSAYEKVLPLTMAKQKKLQSYTYTTYKQIELESPC